MNLYEKYPEFIDSDPRRLRTTYYTVTAEFQQTKHDTIFKNIDFTGKTVLDIGCCVGYTGAYVLDRQAKFYQGVEISEELSNIAKNNFSKYFPADRWNLSNLSVEDFLLTNSRSFDIVIVMGVIMTVRDPASVIENLLKIASTIVFDHIHPPFFGFAPDDNFLENIPYVYYSRQDVNYNDTTFNAEFFAAKAGMGLIKFLFNLHGFDCGLQENREMMRAFPNQYRTASRHRYVIVGNKTENKMIPIGYSDSRKSNTLKLTPF